MDRRETLIGLATDCLQERFAEDLTLIYAASTECTPQLCNNLCEAMLQILRRVQLLQELGQKGAIAYVSFSLMQSNVLMDKFALHIGAYDERFLLDNNEASAEWDFSLLIQNADTNFESVAKIVRKTETRVQEYEILELKRSYQTCYYPVVLEFLPQFLDGCLKQIPLDTVHLCPEVIFTFGKYMEKQLPFYVWRQE